MTAVPRSPVDITLAGRTFTIKPLTCRQLREIEAILAKPTGGTDKAVAVIQTGLSRDNPDVVVDDMEVPIVELQPAMDAVLGQAGGLNQGETPPAGGNAAT